MKNIIYSFFMLDHNVVFKTKIRIKIFIQRTLATVFLIKMHYPHRLVFIAGLPKSGTTWLENLMGAIPGYRRLVCYDLNNSLFEHKLDPAVLEVLPSRGNFYTKTHVEASIEGVAALRRCGIPTVIMVRDIRDQCVSRFFHVLNDPAHRHHKLYSLGERSDAFSHCVKITIDEYLLWVDDWLKAAEIDHDSFLVVRYEDMYSNPKKEFNRVLTHFDIKLTNETVDSILNAISKSSLEGRNIEERLKTHKNTLRKGGSGDWKNHLSAEDIESFKLKANHQLIKLGYESDADW
jgi:hypothetical protein